MKILLLNFIGIFCLNTPTFGGRGIRLSGGIEAISGLVPYIVSIKDIAGNHICGGVIIAPQWVLTTARCIRDSAAELLVATDIADRTNRGLLRIVNRKIPHCKFDESTSANNIGLLSLSMPFDFNEYIQSIPMAQENNLKEGDRLRIAGWGAESEQNNYKLLSISVVDFVESGLCRELLADRSRVNEGIICTLEGNGMSISAGDAGGPLINGDYHLIGIVSGKESFAVDIHTSVPYHFDWINSVMAGSEAC